MYCGMKELTKLTAWDKHYNVLQNGYIPIVKYKGIEFNEEDITDIASNDLEQLYEIEKQGVDELIEAGVLTSAVKGKSYDKDTYDVINDYLCNPNNHENILSQLDDMIYAMQTNEMYQQLTKDAAENFDMLEDDFRNSAESALGKFAAQSDNNLRLLLSQFSDSVDDSIKDIKERRESYAYNTSLERAVEDLLDEKCSADELLSFCEELGVNIDSPYIIYAQNGEYKECYNYSQVIDDWTEMRKQYEGIGAVIYGVEGTIYQGTLDESAFKAFIVELDYKGGYSRFALTEKDFKEEYPNTDIERMREGDTDTLRPMVHIWAEETLIGSDEWNRFFTDMDYGHPQSDIDIGNIAYIDRDECSAELVGAVKATIKEKLFSGNKEKNAKKDKPIEKD